MSDNFIATMGAAMIMAVIFFILGIFIGHGRGMSEVREGAKEVNVGEYYREGGVVKFRFVPTCKREHIDGLMELTE